MRLLIALANVIPKRTSPPAPVDRNKLAARVGVALCLLHLSAFGALVLYIRNSVDPQAPLLWSIFVVTDFPVSLIYLLAGTVYSHGSQHGNGWSQFIYFPYLIHGVLGTLWWYFLPRLVTPRRLGGIW